jgi:hypothetical protein
LGLTEALMTCLWTIENFLERVKKLPDAVLHAYLPSVSTPQEVPIVVALDVCSLLMPAVSRLASTVTPPAHKTSAPQTLMIKSVEPALSEVTCA